MNATTHPFAPEEIMAFVDGELSADCTQSFSSHLETCSECQEVAASLRSTSHSLSNWTAGTVPAHFEKRVLDRSLDIANVLGVGFISKLRRFLRLSPGLAFMGAAFVFVLILIGTNASLHEKRPSAPSRTMDSFTEQPAGEGRGSLGKLESRVPNLSTKAKSDVRSGYVGDSVNYAKSEMPPPPPPPSSRRQMGLKITTKSGTEPAEPMIARTVSLSVVAKEFAAARASLDAILARHNGYAAELSVATPQGNARTIQASLRIPAPQLIATIAELKALGRVENETQNGEEVTEQHANLVARLKNSRETEQRLQDVLRTRTGKVRDVLEVEEEIARVRGEIEQMEAEQQTLEHRVSFATIDLKLAEEYKAQLTSPAPSVGMQLRNATVNGFRNASESFLGIILFFAESGPTFLLWLLILLIPARMLWRRYKRALVMSSSLGG